MSYKRVVKKKGKSYGPYIYESYRDENGKVKKRYLGKLEPEKKMSTSFVVLVGVLAFFLLFAAGYTTDFLFNEGRASGNFIGLAGDSFSWAIDGVTGFVVDDFDSTSDGSPGDSSDDSSPSDSGSLSSGSEVPADSLEDSSESFESVEFSLPEESVQVISEPEAEEVAEEVDEPADDSGDVVVVGNETEELEVNETIVEINETVVEDLEEANETVIENVTETNETVVEVNDTTLENVTEVVENATEIVDVNETIIEINETIVNETLVNETITNITVEKISNVTTLQYRAVIGRPVKWMKRVNVSGGNLTVELPRDASNISVLTNEEIGEALAEIDNYDAIVEEAERQEIVEGGILTGNVALDIHGGEGLLTRLWDWIMSFTISGNVILGEDMSEDITELDNSTVVDLSSVSVGEDEVAVEYYTEAPVAVEVNLSTGKRVTVSGEDEYNYTEILAYTLLDGMKVPMNSSGLKLVWHASHEDAVAYGYVNGSVDEVVDESVPEEVVDEVGEEVANEPSDEVENEIVEIVENVTEIVNETEAGGNEPEVEVNEPEVVIVEEVVEEVVIEEEVVEEVEEVVEDVVGAEVVKEKKKAEKEEEPKEEKEKKEKAEKEEESKREKADSVRSAPDAEGAKGPKEEKEKAEKEEGPKEEKVSGGLLTGNVVWGEEAPDNEPSEDGDLINETESALPSSSPESVQPALEPVVNGSVEIAEDLIYQIEVDYVAHDFDDDGFADYIEWIVPHLSEQVYEIVIEIMDAEHLDSDRVLIENIYEDVMAFDGNWSGPIGNGEYVRVMFEEALDNTKDITVHARSNVSNSTVEVYEVNDTRLIVTFPVIGEAATHKIYLTDLSNESDYVQDVFDLKIIGEVDFDWIVDPFVVGDCDSGDLETTCYLNHTWTATDGDVVNANNLVIQSNGSMANDQGIDLTINLTGNLTIESGGNISLSGANAATAPKAGGDLIVVADLVNITSGGGIYSNGGSCTAICNAGASAGEINISSDSLDIEGEIIFDGGLGIGCCGRDGGSGGTLILNVVNDFDIAGTVQGFPGLAADIKTAGILIVEDDGLTMNVSGTIELSPRFARENDYGTWGVSSVLLNNLNVLSSGDMQVAGIINATNITVQGKLGSEGQDGNTVNMVPVAGGDLEIIADVLNLTGEITLISGDCTANGRVGVNGRGGDLSLTATTAYLTGDINARGGNTIGCCGRDGGDGGDIDISITNDYTVVGDIISDGGNGDDSGDGGDIFINNKDTNLTIEGSVTASVGTGWGVTFGGKINITADGLNVTGTLDTTANTVGTIGLIYDSDLDLSSATVAQNPFITRNTTNAKVRFFSAIANPTTIDYLDGIVIDTENISVDSVAYSDLNVSAELWFYGVTSAFSFPKMNGVACPSDICTEIGLDGTTYKYNVTHFTNYSVGDGYPVTQEFVAPTRADGNLTEDTEIEVNVSIVERGFSLDEFKWNWDGTNYTLFNDSLVLMYNFDNVSLLGENDTHVVDVSNGGNNATVTQAKSNSTDCKYGNCYTFDDAGDYMTTPSVSVDSSLGEITVSSWVYPRSYDAYDGIVCKRTTTTWDFCMYLNDGYMELEMGDVYSNQNQALLPLNEWTHLLATVHSSNNVTYYVNGVYNHTATDVGSLTNGSHTTYIGRIGNYDDYYFDGNIDEVGVWNRYFSADEAAQVYKSSLNKYNQTQWYFYSNQSGLSIGAYTYQSFATDADSNLNATGERSVTIADLTEPWINVTAPSPVNGSIIVEDYAYVNVTSNDSSSLHSTFVDFDNDLLLWMRMDDVNGTGDPTDSSSYGNDGTAVADANWTSDGKLGDAFTFDGTGDYVDLGDNIEEGMAGITYAAWFNWIDDGSDDDIISKYWDGSNRAYRLYINDDSDNKAVCLISTDTQNDNDAASSNLAIPAGEWHHVTCQWNGTTILMYVDGVEQTQKTAQPGNTVRTNNVRLLIGADYYAGTPEDFFKGSIDDVVIFNRSLSATEVGALYNATATQYENNFTELGRIVHNYTVWSQDASANLNSSFQTFEIDSSFPSVSVLSPLDQDYLTANTLFHVSVTDDLAVSTCWYSLDGGVTNTTMSQTDEFWDDTNSSMTQGSHTVNYYCNDSSGNLNDSLSVTFYTDLAIPFINFSSPTPDNESTIIVDNAYINVTSSDASELHSTFVDFDNDLVLWMRMDDIDGSGDPTDSSSSGNDGTAVADANWTSDGKLGDAFTFDGAGDYIETTFEPQSMIGNGSSFSASTWIYIKSYPETYHSIISTLDITARFYLLIENNNQVTPGLGDVFWSDANAYVSTGSWQHLVWTYNGTDEVVYINGSEKDSKNVGSQNLSNVNVRIGADDNKYYFNGSIDDVLIFNRSLSATEVAALYNATATQYENDFTSLAVGQHNYTAYAQDVVGNLNSSSRIVTYEILPIIQEFVDPTRADGNVTTDTEIEVNVSIVEGSRNLDEFKWNWNGTNYTLFNDSLVLMYNFDNRSDLGENDSFVVDVSNGGYNGTFTGGSDADSGYNVSGKYGGSFVFDGVSDYITIPESGIGGANPLLLNDSFVISFWANFKQAKSCFIINNFQGNGDYTGDSVTIHADASGSDIQLNAHIDDNSNPTSFSGPILSLNKWYHVAVVRYKGDNVSFFVDASYDSSASDVTTGSVISDEEWVIGSDSEAPTTEEVNGYIDEIRIYNRSFSVEEIKQLYYSNLYKVNQTQWYFSSSQGALLPGTYTYQTFATDANSNLNATEERSVEVTNVPVTQEFVDPTRADGNVTTDTEVEVNVSIDEGNSALDEFKWNWNGTNYTLFNDSLILMYNFDNVSAFGESNSLIVDVSNGGNNGTAIGAPLNVSGKYGGCYEGDGTNSLEVDTDMGLGWNPSVDPISFSAWVKPDLNADEVFIGAGSGSDQRMYMSAYDGYWRMGIHGSGYGDAGVGTDVAADTAKWSLVTMVMNGTAARLYVDGVFYNYKVYTSYTLVDNIYIGAHGSTSGYNIDGRVDEVRIWNRSLSDDEVSEMYKSNLNKYDTDKWLFYSNQSSLIVGAYTYQTFATDGVANLNATEERSVTITDGVVPAVSINTPLNQTYGVSTVVFNVTATDATAMAGCVYSIDSGVTNVTMTNNGADDYWNATNSSMVSGGYTSNFYCNDSSGNWNMTESVVFGVDVTEPWINFTSPTPDNASAITVDSVYINVTSNDSSSLHSTFVDFDGDLALWMRMDDVNGTGDPTDRSSHGNNGSLMADAKINSTGKLGDAAWFDGTGDYIDVTSAEGFSGWGTVSMWVKRSSTANSQYIFDHAGHNFLCHLTSDGLDFYPNYGSDSTDDLIVNNVTWDSDWHHLAIVADDINNELSFYYDGDLHQKEYETWSAAGVGDFVFGKSGSIDDYYFDGSMDDIMIFNRTLTAGEISAIYNATATQYEHNFTSLAAGQHNYTAYAQDVYGNLNSSSRIVTYDTIYPTFTDMQDDNATQIAGGTGSFNVTVANTNGTVSLEINGTNVTAGNFYGGSIYNATKTFAQADTYSYKWFAYGSGAGNLINVSDIGSYTVNATPTVGISVLYPTVGEQFNATQNEFFNVTLNVTCLEGICGTVNVSLDPFPVGEEIVSERSHNQKVYSLGNNEREAEIHVGHINYVEGDGFEEIDTSLVEDGDGWRMDRASYELNLPATADGQFDFTSKYGGELGDVVSMRPLGVGTVEGFLVEAPIGVPAGAGNSDWAGKKVLYENAFGNNVDLEVVARNTGFDKLIVLNEKPSDLSEDVEFSFEIGLEGLDVLADGAQWDGEDSIEVSNEIVLSKLKETWFRQFAMWDSEGGRQNINVRLEKVDEGYLFTKILDREFLENAVYPVYTDDTTSYYAGSGDGYVTADYTDNSGYGSFSYVASMTDGTSADYTSGSAAVGVYYYDHTVEHPNHRGPPYDYTYFYRGFFPIDTSALDDAAAISSAILSVYGTGAADEVPDAEDWTNVYATYQASTSELVTEDFDQVGSTELASAILHSNWIAGYNNYTLNGGGLAVISKTGVTKIGLREGHDVGASQPAGTYVYPGVSFYTSENAGTSGDPYLSVTYTIAGVKGLISTVVGTTPYYTNASQNPTTTASLSAGESETVTFWVNATGDIGNRSTFFAFANLTSDLSISDITATWTTNITGVVDSTAPTVSINTPLNQTYSTSTIVFNVTATDATAMAGCVYSIDSGVTNVTMTNNGADDYWNATNSSMVSGGYTSNFYCNDSSGNWNMTESVVFEVDTTFPQIAYAETGMAADGATVSQSNVFVNVSLTEANLENMSYSLYNESLNATGLVGYWNFDRNLSDVPDLSLSGNDGSVVNATWNSSGKLGAGMEFDGAGDYVDLGDVSNYPLTGAIEATVGMWVKLDTTAGNQNILGSHNPNGERLYFAKYDGNWDMGIDGLPWGSGHSGSLEAATTEWTYLVVTFNTTDAVMYVNATETISKSYSSIDITGTLPIGAMTTTSDPSYFFNGAIDEVLIFNRSLSATEILELYTRSLVNHTTFAAETLEINWTGLADNDYHYFADALDTSDNYNSTALRSVGLDNVVPTVTVVSPTDGSTYTPSVLFNVSSSEAGTGFIVPDLDSSLVSWWRMDDVNGSGDPVDYTGRNNGTLEGDASISSAGKFGDGAVFDGAGDYVDVDDDDSLDLGTHDLTVSAWIKAENSVMQNIFAKRGGSYGNGYELRVNADEGLYLVLLNTTSYIDVASANSIIQLGEWHHVVAVFDRDVNFSAYSNGQLVATKTFVGTGWENQDIDGTYTFKVGIMDWGGQGFNGTIDEVAIFNRSLTADEILALYNATRISHTDTLAAGSHTYEAYSSDVSGNVGTSGLLSFTVDDTFPVLDWIAQSPRDGGAVNHTDPSLNVSVTESGESYAFLDDGLVLWMRMDDVNGSGDPTDISGHCYDDETEILTEAGWKLFVDLDEGERVMTLDQETGAGEWEVPIAYQEFDNSKLGGEMYRVVTESGDLVVSEKHLVYSSKNLFNSCVLNTLTDSVTDASWKCESFDQIAQLNLSATAKYCTSLGSGQMESALLRNGSISDLEISDILSLKIKSTSENSCSERCVLDNICDLYFSNSVNKNSGAISSSLLERNNLAVSESLINAENKMLASTTSNIDYSSEDSACLLDSSLFTFRPNSIASSSVSSLSLVNSCSTFNCSALCCMACLATADQFMIFNSSIVFFKSSGIDNVSVGIVSSLVNLVNTSNAHNTLFKSFGLQPITEVYSDFNSGEEVWFLDSDNKPVRVEGIERVDYDGKIYDVDVANDVVLVRRGGEGGLVVWSGNSNNGSAVDGASQVSSGKFGEAFEFDGAGDYVDCGSPSSLNIVGPITLSAWVKPSGALGAVINKDIGVGRQYVLAASTTTADALFFGSPSPVGYAEAQKTGLTLNDGNWHSLVATITPTDNGGDGLARMYVDGMLVTTGGNNISSINSALTQPLWIGDRSSPWPFTGSIDEVLIWNRSLSATEIQALYNSSEYKLQRDLSGLAETTHNYTAHAVDEAGNRNSSSLFFEVDLTDPFINFTSPTPGDGESQANSDIYVNVSATDTATNVSTFIDFDNSLVSWWRMDDVNGSGDFVDYMGRNNGSNVGGVSQVEAGYFGKGAAFDGAGDYVDLTALSTLNNDTYTISVWFYIKEFSYASNYIIYSGATGTSDERLRFYVTSAGVFYVQDDFGMSLSKSSMQTNTWYHSVVAYDYPNGTATLYLDGLNLGSDASLSQAPSELTYGNSLGRRLYSSFDFNGSLDDVMIFNRSLSAVEIAALYANSSTKYVGVNFTGLADGSHSFAAYSQDLAGNVNTTGSRTVAIDSGFFGDCGTLGTANMEYTLTNNVTAAGTCFTVTAENVTLDCAGYEINYSNAGTLGYGVYSDQFNTTVKGCEIVEGVSTTNSKHAVYYNGGDNGTIENNTIGTSGASTYGIRLYSSSNNNINNNTITISGWNGGSVYLITSSNANNVISNNITVINPGKGVYIVGSSNNQLISNTISTSGAGTAGFYIATVANSNNFTNNTITTTGSGSAGIILTWSSYNTFTSNQVNSSQGASYSFGGVTSAYYNHSIDTTNLAEGLPVLYNYSISDQVIENLNDTYGQIICAWCDNVTYNNINMTQGDGISFYYTDNSTINNSILSMDKGDKGVYLYSSSQNNITNNQINTSVASAFGVYLSTSANNNLISGNEIGTSGTSGSGVYLLTSCSSNTLSNNNVTTSGSSGRGVYLSSSSLNTISNNTIITSERYGFAVHLYKSSHNMIDNIDITTSYAKNAYGIFLQNDVLNNTIKNSHIKTTGETSAYGLYATSDIITAYIIDTIINATGSTDVYTSIDTDAGSWLNFINVTFNETETSINDVLDLNVSWYLDVNVTNSTGALEDVNVSAADVNGETDFSVLTLANGSIARQTLIEYMQNSTGKTYYTDYTVTAAKATYSTYTNSSVNMTDNVWIDVELVIANTAPDAPVVWMNASSSLNVTSDDVLCNFETSDPDGDALDVSVDWYVNGTFNQSVEYSGVANSTDYSAELTSGNTTKNQNWSCSVRFYDGTAYGGWTNSSNITILNSLPTVTLSAPVNESSTTDRTPDFSWSGSDADGDSLTYEWNISDHKWSNSSTSVCSDSRLVDAGSSGSYTPTSDLDCLQDNGYNYDWRVRATDNEGVGVWASDYVVNITSEIGILLSASNIDFGSLDYLGENDTSDDSPSPFVVENNGSVSVNISVNSSALWGEQPSDSTYYQFKVDNVSGEEGAFDWLGSIVSWLNMPIGSQVVAIDRLNYSDGKDSAEVDIRVEVPQNEEPGVKDALIIFTGSLGE